MNSLILALSFLAATPPAQAQQDSGSEVRFHRIHLRNGNFIDGKLTADKPNEVIVLMSAGEMSIRRDQIDHVEVVRMKSYNDKAIVLDTPKAKKDDPSTPRSGKAAEVITPEQIKRKVDIMIVRMKSTTGEREFNAEELRPLGDDGTAYLVSKATTLDLRSLDAVSQAVIGIKPGPKTVEVLEGLLENAVPSIRGMALTILVVAGGDPARAKYIRPLMADKDPRVRETVLGMLGPVEEEVWYEPILDLCADPDKEVRNRALRIARGIVAKHNLEDKFLRVLQGNYNNPNDGVRADSLAMVASYGKKESWSSVAPLLADSESAVRAAAAQALMNLGAPESGEAIAAAMPREQDKWTRIYLASAAQKLQLQAAAETLVSWLSDPSDEIRKVSYVALKGISGVDLGIDAARWQTWLKSRGK